MLIGLRELLAGLIDRIKGFLKEKKNRRLAAVLILLFFYTAGILAQFLNNRHQWAPGRELPLPSINPLKGFAMLTTSFGAQAIAGLFLFAMLAALLFFLFKEDRAGMKYDKKRKFWYSDKGVYGTAAWMGDKELKESFDLTPEEQAGQVNEIICCYKDGMVVSRKADSRLNPHIAVMVSSRSMKSRDISRGLIMACAKRGESVVVTDSKGELASDTVQYLRDYGYDVKIFNLADPKNSNTHNGLEGAKEDTTFIANIVDACISNTGGVGDPIYDAAEGALLTALILQQYENEQVTGEFPSLKGAYRKLLQSRSLEELDAEFDDLDENSRAALAYNLYRKASPNMRGNIQMGLGVRLKVLQNEEIAELMSCPDMDIQQLGLKKTAYFLILSDQDTTMQFVSATFFSLMFLQLVQYADNHGPDRRLPVPVTLLLDEFCSLVGSINSFHIKLSNVRSRGISICIIFQQLGQLSTVANMARTRGVLKLRFVLFYPAGKFRINLS